MSIDLERDLDYDSMLDTLVEKTKAGKITWSPTASEDAFQAAVGGKLTFEISSSYRTMQDLNVPVGGVALTVRDAGGEVLLRVSKSSPAAEKLLSMAKRIATNVDEKFEAAMRTLSGL